MPYSLRLSDGRVVSNIPDNVSEDMVLKQIQALPAPKSAEQALADIKPEYGTGEALSRGFSRGVTQLESAFGDVLPAVGASALGFDDYAKRQMEEAAQSRAEIARTNPAQYESYKDVQGLGDAIGYAAETVGELGPQVLTALVPGGIGGAIGRRVGLAAAERAGVAGTELAAAGAESAATGQIAGTYLGSYAQNAPEIFQNIYDETGGSLEPGAALLASTVSAGLDSVLPAQLLRSITGPVRQGIVEKVLERSGMDAGLARSVTAGVIKGVPGEGLTEGAQEAISIATEKFVQDNAEVWGSEEWNRIIDSSIRGAIGGGVFGGVSGVPSRLQERAGEQRAIQEEQTLQNEADRAIYERQAEEQARLDDINARVTENLGLVSTAASEEERAQRQQDLEEALQEYDSYNAENVAKQEQEQVAQEEQKQAEWRASIDEKLSTPEGVQEVIKNLGTKKTDFPQYNKQLQNQIRTQLQRRLEAFKVQNEEAQATTQAELEKVFAKVKPTPITEATPERLQSLGFTPRAQKELTGLTFRKRENFQKLLDLANNQNPSRAADARAAASYIEQLPTSITEPKKRVQEAPVVTKNEEVKKTLSPKSQEVLGNWEAANAAKESSSDIQAEDSGSDLVEQGAGASMGMPAERLTTPVQEVAETATRRVGDTSGLAERGAGEVNRGAEAEPSTLAEQPAKGIPAAAVPRTGGLLDILSTGKELQQYQEQKYGKVKSKAEETVAPVEVEDVEDLVTSNEKRKAKAKDTIGKGLRKFTKTTASIVPEEDVSMGEVLTALADLMLAYIEDGVRSMGDAIRRARKDLGAEANNITHAQMVDAFKAASDRSVERAKEHKATVVNQPKQTLRAIDQAIQGLPGPVAEVVDNARDAMSNLPDAIRKQAMGLFGLAQKYDMYGKELPSIKTLEKVIELRAGDEMVRTNEVKDLMTKGYDILKKHTPQQVASFNKIAMDSTRYQIDVLSDAAKGTQLYTQFHALPTDMQELYRDLRNAYDKYSKEYVDYVTGKISDKGDADKLRAKFESARLKVYLPMMRFGDYWLEYTDAAGERVVEAYESKRARDTGRDAAASKGARGFQDYSRLSQITATKGQVPAGFMTDLVNLMQKGGVDQSVIDQAYQSYLSLFPAQSIRQQFREREGVAGYSEDVMQGFANVGSRMAHQLSQLKYGPQLDEAMNAIEMEAGKTATSTVKDVVGDIRQELAFLRNPVHHDIAQKVSYWTYFNYIIGNVSSALINLTNLPIMTYSVLGGEYGWGKAGDAMQRATGLYMKGGLNKYGDWTTETNAKGDIGRLLAAARSRAAIGRSAGYELVDMMRTKAEDYNGLKSKIEKVMGWVFQNSEQMNREIGIISAYLLAKEGGMTHEQAIEKAITTSTLVNGPALAETGPRFFQQGLGKVLFIFKRFAQAQLYMTTRLMYQAFKGESADVRRVAMRQLMGIYGTSFAFAGAAGMPFMGAGTTMYAMLNAMLGDDDEPFDADEELRMALGDLVYKGPVNKMLNVDIANRTGFGNLLWRDDSKRLSEVGPVAYTLERLAGPAYSLALNYERGYDLFRQGHTERALEAMSPSFMRNVFKASRFATEGATNLDGVPIVDDISTYNVAMQLLGFSDAELAEAYAQAGAMKQAEKQITDRRTALLNLAYLARSTGDSEGYAEVRDKIRKFSQANPEKGIAITESTLKKSYEGHIQRNKETVNGVRINPKLKSRLADMYADEEDEE